MQISVEVTNIVCKGSVGKFVEVQCYVDDTPIEAFTLMKGDAVTLDVPTEEEEDEDAT